jgi:DNA-binding CsgD family transcriptional regulator
LNKAFSVLREKILNVQRASFCVAEISGQEAQILKALETGEQEIPERYSGGPELEPDGFKGLRDEEIVTLYGTLADLSAKKMAEKMDLSPATVSNYRSNLVEQEYLKNLQPGKGPSEYRPGLETQALMNGYEEQIPVLEDVDAARPMETEDEGLRWLVGEEIYEIMDEGLYEDLSGKEALALEMTLEGKSRDRIADTLDVTPGTVSHYRTDLVEKDYMRNLQPGRGPGEYIPGIKVIEAWDEYSPEIEMLEADPARPLKGGEGLKWLLGEELNEMLSENGTEGEKETLEERIEALDTDFKINVYSEAEVETLLTRVDEDGSGFGRIADEIGTETAHSLADDLEQEGFLEEDSGQVSGLALTDQGKNYLEILGGEEIGENGKRNTKKSGSRSSSSSNSSNRRKNRGNEKADKGLLEIGDELLDGHEEKISQAENAGIDSRDLTDSEEKEVEMEDDKAGYEGFT